MATNYPTSLDSLTNPVSTDTTTAVDHAAQHSNANDAIEALEAKVGIDGSAVTTSHDYKLSGVTGTNKAASTSSNSFTSTQTTTIADTSNVKGIVVYPNDRTNFPLGLQVGPDAAKVTSSTLVQFNDSNGDYSDWAFNVSGGGVPAIILQASRGTLSSPTMSTGGLGAIDNYGYNSSNVQKQFNGIEFNATNLSAGGEYGGITFKTMLNGIYSTILTLSSTVNASIGLFVSHATAGIGYSSGAGGTVTQTTSRSTGVTLNRSSGRITLVSAAGSTTPTTFTVSNTAVADSDTVILSQKSGTDKYILSVTNVSNSAFSITFYTTGGTTTEQPVFNFNIIKGTTA